MHRTLKSFKPAQTVLVCSLIVGVAARLWLPFHGHNFDIESYKIVAAVIDDGGNVYAETARYNYGPVWFHVLDWIHSGVGVVGGGDVLFRHAVAWFLILIDVALALLLSKRFNPWVGVAVLLNPVSMIITGYHSQFGNFAILIAFVAVIVAFPRERASNRRFLAGLIILGVSLATKHLFFLLPFWLVFRADRWRDRILIIAVPYMVFVAAFIPYWADGSNGIEANVIRYKSFANAPLLRALTPWQPSHQTAMLVMLAALGLAGALIRRQRPETAVGVYTIVLVAFSPAIANQYLAIPTGGIAILGIGWFLPYIAVATYHLITDSDGLRLLADSPKPFDRQALYEISTIMLTAGLLARFVVRARSRRTVRPTGENVDL